MANKAYKAKPDWWRDRYNSCLCPHRPFTEEEDAIVIDMANCGVTSRVWAQHLPGRRFGEIAERMLELREAGLARYPTPL